MPGSSTDPVIPPGDAPVSPDVAGRKRVVYKEVLERIQHDTGYELDDLEVWFAADETARNRLRRHCAAARNPNKVLRVVFNEKSCAPKVVAIAREPSEDAHKAMRKRAMEAREVKQKKAISATAELD